MRLVGKLLLGLVLTLLVVAVGAYWWQRPLLLTATGYAAHNACAVERVAGRTDPEDDLPPNPLVPILSTTEDGTTTTGSLLGVLAKQRVGFTPGYGCTVAEVTPSLPPATDVDAAGNPFAAVAPPTPDPTVAAAVARAFGDDLPAADKEELGTRAVLVLKDGDLIAERYAGGFDADTPQLGWSMSKSVANLMVGRLVEEGSVSLNDDGLRSEWTDGRADITIEDLMTMTSGLAWDETYDLGTPITRMLYLEPDMGAYVASQKLAHQPGTYQQYSSGSTTLLCDILGERVGTPAAELPRQLVLGPLGLANATMETDGAGTPVCSSYLWATPREWAAVGQFALQEGEWNGERLLPAGWMTDATEAVAAKGEQEGYAAGWWANLEADGSLAEPSLPEDAYFAKGHDGQWIVVVPSQGLVVVRLGFTPVADDDRVVRLTADLLATS